MQGVVTTDDLITLDLDGITGGDLLKIDNEIVKIEGIVSGQPIL